LNGGAAPKQKVGRIFLLWQPGAPLVGAAAWPQVAGLDDIRQRHYRPASSLDIADARRRVDFELATAFAYQVLYGGEILFANLQVLPEFMPVQDT
jgi:hypothetical protein